MLRLRIAAPVLVLGLLTSGWLLGQDKKPDPKEPIIVKASLPANYKKLGLSDKQKKEIYRIRGKYAVKIDELKQQIADLQQKEKSDVENVLTNAQKALLKEIRSGGTSKDKDKPTIKDKPTEKKKP